MMLSYRYCMLLQLIGCEFATVIGDFNIDSLISRAEIYYVQPSPLDAPHELPLDKVKELSNRTNFKVIIHGYTGSRFHSSITPLGNTYMAKGMENVLLADWSDAASLDYHHSRNSVGKVAKVFGKLLDDFIARFHIDPEEMHVIGHSLGAHIAGGIGEYFNGTLGRVTGLDPALPLFSPYSQDSLHATAALFVDVVHTDFPIFGDITPRGTVDFYPSYGRTPQKGCDDFDLLATNSCSHNRAVLFFAESIGSPKNFPTFPCNLNALRQRNAAYCHENLDPTVKVDRMAIAEGIANMDDSLVIYMGEYVSKRAYGIYYLDTYDAPPYGMGLNSKFW